MTAQYRSSVVVVVMVVVVVVVVVIDLQGPRGELTLLP
jgi:hypothetical protein